MSESVAPSAAPSLEPVRFTGTGAEYFRIWIVNLALSILTLGIYSAWAKVRRLKYFHGSTRLAGHAFDYHGEPLVILRGRIIGVLALAAYVALLEFVPAAAAILVVVYVVIVPWIVTRARVFQMRMTSWRGVRFDFEPDYAGAFRALILAPLLTVLSLGFAAPWAVRLRHQWLIGNTAYGNSWFRLEVALKPVAMVVLRTVGIALLGLLAIFGSIMLLGLLGAVLLQGFGQPPAAAAIAVGLLLYLPVLAVSYLLMAYWRRSVLNLMLPSTSVGPLRLHCRLSARRLAFVYLTNIAGIILTLGLYTPWARVRVAKTVLESTGVVAEAPIEDFVASETERTSAVGEEVGELFDVDIGL